MQYYLFLKFLEGWVNFIMIVPLLMQTTQHLNVLPKDKRLGVKFLAKYPFQNPSSEINSTGGFPLSKIIHQLHVFIHTQYPKTEECMFC